MIISGGSITISGGANYTAYVPPQVALAIVTSNLILHLDAGNVSSYSGTGTSWTDISSSRKPANLTSVSYTASNGGALVFNGSNSKVTVGNATSITALTNNFTTEVWYKSNNVAPKLLATGIGSLGFNFGQWPSQNPTKFKVTKYSVIDLFVGTVPAGNIWHQAVLTYSSNAGTRVYVDGALSETNSSNATLTQGQSTFTIGLSEGGYHNGSISIVRMYNRALSQDDILRNFNANKSRFGLE